MHFLQFIISRTYDFREVAGLIVLAVIITAVFVRVVVWGRWKRLFRKKSRAVVSGLIHEQFAPIMKGFPGNPSEARFIGKPVDFVVFRGLSTGEVNEIIFVEVKSHPGISLNSNERSVRKAVEKRMVRWEQYHPPA